jgi:hypothetical protein
MRIRTFTAQFPFFLAGVEISSNERPIIRPPSCAMQSPSTMSGELDG